jgi:hypothetical protein
MARRPRVRTALAVGINYPGTSAQLHGCVNDALDWTAELVGRGYNVTTLLDGQATRDAILGTLDGMVRTARYGDRLAFTISSHGTWAPDRDGDEADGRDEAIVPVDYRTAGIILDDDLHEIYQRTPLGVRFYVFGDLCHSGSLTRSFGAVRGDGVPRFLPPVEWADEPTLERAKRVEFAEARGKPRSGPVFISGCEDSEYSYDASFGRRANGAATYWALRTLPEAKTVADWHRRIRQQLPDTVRGFEQHPQLTASRWQSRWRPFD